MEQQARTFIALKIIPDSKFLQIYSDLKNTLFDEAIKWVENDNFHLTLRFLGNTTFNQNKEIQIALKDIAISLCPFQFNLKGLGYFKTRRNPKVLFAKIEDSEQLKHIADKIDQKFVTFGFEQETRAFQPHLTLGRIKFIKDKNNFFSLMEKHEETAIQKINVSEIIFYKSILSSSAPIYKPIITVKLKS